MNLLELVSRSAPVAWNEGDNIPWNEPEFSRRMLKEHLSQDHDAASRRVETVERQVRFIHDCLLGGKTARILDLGCGPGLYSHRLARLGHCVVGVDFSPASIAYARQVAEQEQLDCTYIHADMRLADFGSPGSFDLAMFIYGEYHVFCRQDASLILRKANAALKTGGLVLLELSTEESVRKMGQEPPAWYTKTQGLFSDRPHLMLHESAWDEGMRVATNRHILVDAETGEVTPYGASYQAYTQAEIAEELQATGFMGTQFYPSLTGEGPESDFYVVSGIKGVQE